MVGFAKKIILTIAASFLLLCGLASAQDVDPAIESVLFPAEELGPNFGFQDSSVPLSPSGYSDEILQERLYFAIDEPFGSPEAPYEMRVRANRFPTDESLRSAWWASGLSNVSPTKIRPEDLGVGDSDFIAFGSIRALTLLRGRVILVTDIPPFPGEPSEDHENRVGSILAKLFERVDSLGDDSVGEFDVDFLITQTQEAVEFSATSSQELKFGATLRYYLWREDLNPRELISGPVEFTNDFSASASGEIETTNLQVGEYSLVLEVEEKFFFRDDSITFNFTIGDSGPSSLNLPTTKDSTLRAKKPHRNEGANPRLFLSHRLEARGKSQNPIVGFDLTEADLNGLTSATLVMNIQDCDLPRRWGQNGRFIEAHPVTRSWVEGNGNKFRVQGNDGKTKGEGPGATWFSPVDDQIRNNRPNGSEMWNGARTSFGTITAPAVQVTNGQTGPIEFDVTADLQALNSPFAELSWVLKKSDEGKFGNIRFFSKENGDSELAPKLLLEYGGQVSQDVRQSNSLLSALGFGINRPMFQLADSKSELLTFREALQKEPVAAFLGESIVSTASGQNPLVSTAVKVAYRAWLS